jgi:hypothetical protein
MKDMKLSSELVTMILAVGLAPAPPEALAVECIPCPECDAPRAEDTMICGCFESSPGVIGSTTALADVGAGISIPIQISTNSAIDAFTLDFEFPRTLLRYDSTSVGDLTAGFDFFGANDHPELPLVRVGGFDPGGDTIPSGVVGDLAILHFTVIASGCASTCPVTLLDDVSDYLPCFPGVTSTHEPTILLSPWGRIKSAYRSPDSP